MDYKIEMPDSEQVPHVYFLGDGRRAARPFDVHYVPPAATSSGSAHAARCETGDGRTGSDGTAAR